jgi:L-seryl-tRNA(Ser) seleniumtransferase
MADISIASTNSLLLPGTPCLRCFLGYFIAPGRCSPDLIEATAAATPPCASRSGARSPRRSASSTAGPGGSPDPLARALRLADPPVVARVDEGHVVFDPRTVLPGEDDALVAALEAGLRTAGRS